MRGAYLWGSVGRGKTFMMDLLFESLPFDDKVRYHFHRLMNRVHGRLRTLRDEQDPLATVAAELAGEARIICFDEFFVADIADAMLLATLLEELFKNGVSLVATSNIVPDGLYKAGRIELELVPQGTMAERLRAAGAGIGAFYTPTAYGTDLADGKETRVIDGRAHVLEYPLHGDVALVCADRGDRWGNLVYRKAGRNFGPVMATAARRTIAQVREIVPLGALDPEAIVTPGIFVARVVQASDRADAAATPRAA